MGGNGSAGRAAAVLVTALLGTVLAVPAAASGGGAAEPAGDVTSAVEAERVDRVEVGPITWSPCGGRSQCAVVALPLDYDQPDGPKVDVAVLRRPARRPAQRIGSLFLNPGGPGGSGIDMARDAHLFLAPAVLDRFDIIGVDPRGIARSQNVRCFTDPGQQLAAVGPLFERAFPWTEPQVHDWIVASRALGRACATTGRPLAASMSTAQVARDFDVLRRALGDRYLNYLGLSYGTYLGQVYAALFPDRVRAVILDGVLDGVAWAGRPATADLLIDARLRSAEGAAGAFWEILRRCSQVGPERCAFAGGDEVARFDRIARHLKAEPLVLVDPGGNEFEYGYPELIGDVGSLLYGTEAEFLTEMLAQLEAAVDASASGDQRDRGAASAPHVAELRASSAPEADPYDNGLEAFASVLCTDTLNPQRAELWPAMVAERDRQVKHFARFWGWVDTWCAERTWTAGDEDAYRGPFDPVTAHPVLVIGNFWDPATNYRSAVQVARRLPNSRLLSSDSWGHVAFDSSPCVGGAITSYLLDLRLPPEGTTCKGTYQPFESGEADRTRVVVNTSRPATPTW